MEKKSPSLAQVYAISSVENLVSILYAEPEEKFREITELIDKNRITEHEDMMEYLYSLLLVKGYPEYAAEFARKYGIQIAESAANDDRGDSVNRWLADIEDPVDD